MDFWATVLVLFRRWYVTLPTFALALAAAAAVYSSIPTLYVSNSVLVLTIPTSGGSLPSDPKFPNALTNPLLNFDKGLSLTASILIQELATPETVTALGVTRGGTTKYKVTNGTDNPELLSTSPFVFIQGESRTPEGARDVVTRVGRQAKVVLAERQKALNAPPTTYITLSGVVAPTTPQAQRSGKLRAAAAAVGLGLVASLSAAFGMESLLNSRRARRRGRPPEGPSPRGTSAAGDRLVAGGRHPDPGAAYAGRASTGQAEGNRGDGVPAPATPGDANPGSAANPVDAGAALRR
jgi:hypothetical protein